MWTKHSLPFSVSNANWCKTALSSRCSNQCFKWLKIDNLQSPPTIKCLKTWEYYNIIWYRIQLIFETFRYFSHSNLFKKNNFVNTNNKEKCYIRGGTKVKIGIALSGGGIRGVAHAGVLKALEDNQIEIDIIGGTSAGSMVASLYVMG